MAEAFSAQISGQIPGWPAANWVMSRNPPAANRSSAPSCSAPALAAFMSVAATRCGTCDTTATRRSWSSGERTRTSAPKLMTTPLRRSNDSRVNHRGHRRQHPHRALEEVRIGAMQSDLLGAGHGVTAYRAEMISLPATIAT